MQQVEKDRLNTIKAKLTRYVQLQQTHLQDHQQIVEDVNYARHTIYGGWKVMMIMMIMMMINGHVSIRYMLVKTCC